MQQAANGFANGEPGSSRGVNVAVESQSEWKIDHIQFDGTEVFEPPPDFAEIVAKNVTKIQWQDVLENASKLDDAEEADEAKEAEKELVLFDSVREAARDRIVPVAGPWAGVAKSLHESLQEVDVLLDLLRVSRSNYLSPLKVAPPNEDNQSLEVQNKSKSFLWVSRRKAFFDAINILDIASRVRQYANQGERAAYFNELKKMRENWRIRKINEFIVGDLGYRIYGQKFVLGELFDVLWDANPKPSTSEYGVPPQRIQVQIPKNLLRRTKLSVSLMQDNAESQDKIFTDDDPSSPLHSIYQQTDMAINLPWEVTLKWAQESLVNRDIFTRLMKEAVNEKHICVVTENTITVCLTNGMLLKIERHFYPPMEMTIPELGDPYLTNILHDFFLHDVVRPPHRPQLFVGFPVSSLPETLDFRGPQGIAAEEIASRVDKSLPLLARMIRVADHYSLLDQVMDVLSHQMLCKDDPQFTWRWLRCTPTFSMIAASFTNQCYESLGKTNFTIKIDAKEVCVITKDNLTINCHSQMKLLQDALSQMSANCQLLAASLLGKTYSWQVLHANTNAVCVEGTLAPTFYACNQTSTKKLFIQFYTDGRSYQIYVKRRPPASEKDSNSAGAKPTKHEPMDVGGKRGESRRLNCDPDDADEFVPINNARLMGKSFLRKLDYLYTIFQH